MQTIKNLSELNIAQIAGIIQHDWKNVSSYALPYLDAMFSLNTVQDMYGCDDGRSIVLYFLSNSQSWSGEIAKSIKAELKKRVK